MNDLPLNHVARREPSFLQQAPKKNASKAWPFIVGFIVGGVAEGLSMGRLHSVEARLQAQQAGKDRQALVAQMRMDALEATLYRAGVDAVGAELENPESARFHPMHETAFVKNGPEWILNVDFSSRHAGPRVQSRAQVFFEVKDLQCRLKDVEITML